VYAAANAAMVQAYWQIGRRIVEEEQGGATRAEYGTLLIRNLSRDLGDEFGKGLSIANLKNFRQFYLTFPDAGKSYALRSELSWTHWRLVMRVENPQARDYYIEETSRQQWRPESLGEAGLYRFTPLATSGPRLCCNYAGQAGPQLIRRSLARSLGGTRPAGTSRGNAFTSCRTAAA
jgi:hypothetical protein